ncbi:hypothetical protein FDUTEX481_09910 [Tolypothrix sp. PCC 7601]|nr:hypothetical protein FDUTEX481_09910 [Tolypothrix sp. PCC 7601]
MKYRVACILSAKENLYDDFLYLIFLQSTIKSEITEKCDQ